MWNELIILQCLLLVTIVIFNSLSNIFAAWIIAGLYLIGVGCLVLLDDGDILIGFLWLIDFGVGLVVLIFIVYLLAFLSQKAKMEWPARVTFFTTSFAFFILIYFNAGAYNSNSDLQSINYFWTFLISWYDYYELFSLNASTDLLQLREIYFGSNSFEFFIINFMGFYAIIAAILLTFVIKKSIHYFSKNMYDSIGLIHTPHTSFFFRSQNFIKQRQASTGSRVWFKTRNLKK